MKSKQLPKIECFSRLIFKEIFGFTKSLHVLQEENNEKEQFSKTPNCYKQSSTS